VSARARRLTLRVAADGRVTCTRPRSMPLAEACSFAEAKADWIEARVSGLPPDRAVAEGARIRVEDRPLRLARADVARAEIEGDVLRVPREGEPGPAAAAFLRALAGRRAQEACARHADALGLAHGPVRVRDTRSRWGSCTAKGALMLSWRLAMAPREVLCYVAAHEVAHLVRMDHSPAFWAVVERLDPDWRERRAWLRSHGGALLRLRFEA
jgi:predicted metal-dependent hydrolase